MLWTCCSIGAKVDVLGIGLYLTSAQLNLHNEPISSITLTLFRKIKFKGRLFMAIRTTCKSEEHLIIATRRAA